MKKIFVVFAIAVLVAACNNSTETKADVSSDSTILLAPESSSNMSDTRGIFTDSSSVDSNTIKTDTSSK